MKQLPINPHAFRKMKQAETNMMKNVRQIAIDPLE